MRSGAGEQPMYVFPGSFSPPTVGHLYVVRKAAAFLPEVTIVCSSNPAKKNPWFTQEECKKLWLSYPLPAHVHVVTFAEIEHAVNGPDLVMIRGIRDEKDYDYEKKVLFYNAHHYNVSKALYIVHDQPEEQFCSSTKVRALAEELNLEELGAYVSPMVLSALLEKVLKIKNLFMVVGKAGSGKSTFLKMLHEIDPRNVYINTDELNHELRPLIREHFKGENLIDVALHKEDELLKLITHPWLELLKTRLKSVPSDSNVFLEIAYGLQSNKQMYRYVGGKVLYIGCKQETNIARNKQRGTPHLQVFIDRIPDLEATQKIAKEQQLELMSINTDCSLADLQYQAQQFNTLVWIRPFGTTKSS
jgi:pantetheine-phosphate adenylyltransferase